MPCGQLLEASAGADECQVGDVDRCDQEHEERTAPQQPQRSTDVANEVPPRAGRRAAIARVDQRIFQGAGAFEIRALSASSCDWARDVVTPGASRAIPW